jgi:virginiamycin B lyase
VRLYLPIPSPEHCNIPAKFKLAFAYIKPNKASARLVRQLLCLRAEVLMKIKKRVISTIAIAIFVYLPSAWSQSNAIITLTHLESTQVQVSGDWMGVGFGSVWEPSEGFLYRIEPTSGAVLAKIPVGARGPFRGVTISDTYVWIANLGDQLLYKIDPQTNMVKQSIPVPMSGSEGSLAASGGSVWIAANSTTLVQSQLLRIDEASGEVRATTQLPESVNALTFANHQIWSTSALSGKVIIVDAQSGALAATMIVGRAPRFVTAGAGSVWLLTQADGHLLRLNSVSKNIELDLDLGAAGTGGDITFAEGYIWISTRAYPLIKIDPATNAIVQRSSDSGYGDAIRVGYGAVWISGATLHRIPLKD